ncbi:MAG: hypothetical protein ABWY25_03000, partial [Paenisporosarcina sp.]
VLYLPEGNGIVWNGLTSLEEQASVTREPLFFDGQKFEDIVTIDDFAATLRAFTYPDEFLQFEGIEEFDKGLFVNDQIQARFHLSYRTRLNNALDQHAYKIHIWYNLTAVPSAITFESLSNEVAPVLFEWSLTAIPTQVEGFQPTAHFVIDSRKMDQWLLQDVEEILYGNEVKDPYLPPAQGFTNYIKKWDRLIIEDHGDGTWSATSQREGQIVMLDETTFQINDATATYLDPETYEISSTPANEEDLWQQ